VKISSPNFNHPFDQCVERSAVHATLLVVVLQYGARFDIKMPPLLTALPLATAPEATISCRLR